MDTQTIVILVVGIVQAIVAPVLFWAGRALVDHGKRIEACATDDDLDAVRERVAANEAKLDAVDVMSEIRAVHGRVDDVATSTATVAGEMKSAVRSLELITRHLIGTPPP